MEASGNSRPMKICPLLSTKPSACSGVLTRATVHALVVQLKGYHHHRFPKDRPHHTVIFGNGKFTFLKTTVIAPNLAISSANLCSVAQKILHSCTTI